MIPDSRLLTPEKLREAAQRARQAHDAREFCSRLEYFNSGPCAKHAPEIERGCTDCGIELRRHQRTGTAWLYFALRGLLADSCGLGKTACVAAVLAACKQTGELSPQNRAVIIAQASAVLQWGAELRRLVPSLHVITADEDPQKRMQAYLGGWEACVISDRTLAPAGSRGGDVERLRQFPVGIVVYDDTDAMRSGSTRTAYAVRKLAGDATRVYGLHATPLQKRLMELYFFLEPVGSPKVFGTAARFRREYVSQGQMKIWLQVRKGKPAERNSWARSKGYRSYADLEARARDGEPEAARLVSAVHAGRARFQRVIHRDNGVKENALPEFKRLAAPMILRRTARDVDDVELPDVQSHEVWLDLLPAQRERYDELRKGVLRRLRDAGTEISRVEAAAAFTRGAQICSGLASLDDGRDVSAKLDWAADRITGDFSEDKVLCFVYYRPNVAALSARLSAEGLAEDEGHILLWSEETSARVRAARIARFTEDPKCRVAIATTTAERSLNLQAASHLIAVDTILNPARMTQILGRVRRQGSRYRLVFFHHLLARDTQEEGYLPLLRAEQGLADAVWDDTGELFTASLSPRQTMKLVAGEKLAA